MNTIIFPGKSPTEIFSVTVQFADRVQVGETISSAAITVSMFSGTDPTPSAIISGSPSISGTNVTFTVTGGVSGCIYVLAVAATMNNANVYIKEGCLAIVATDPF